MARRAKGESLLVVLDGLLQILHLSQLLKASANNVGKVIERRGATWIVGRVRVKSLLEAVDGLLQILHLSQPLKASENSNGEVIERYGVA
jgi:hypothetical protein